MMATLSFEPLISPALWIALAIGAVVLIAIYAMRAHPSVTRTRWCLLIGLMGSCIAFVLCVLLNPTWVSVLPQPEGKPLLTFLVDGSESMKTPDGALGKTRLGEAGEAATKISEACRDRVEVNTVIFASTGNPVSIEDLSTHVPTGRITDLSTAIRSALKDSHAAGQAIVLLSDGIDTADRTGMCVMDAARLAKAMAVPIYTRAIGGDPAVKDLRIEPRSTYEVSFAGQRFPLEVRFHQQGLVGAAVTVSVLQEGKEVDRKEIRIASASQTVEFTLEQKKPGLYSYELRASVIEGERTPANNTASFVLRTFDTPGRVLLVEGKPYWDTKFLARTLNADPAVELESVVRLAEGRYLRQSIPKTATSSIGAGPPTSMPVRSHDSDSYELIKDVADLLANRERLASYRIIVIGRETDTFLTESSLSALRDWVSRDGGAIVFFRGSPTAQVGERLAKLLPVQSITGRERRFRMQLTDAGRSTSWLETTGTTAFHDALPRLPELVTDVQSRAAKPAAVILAAMEANSNTDDAAFVYQPYGMGRVVMLDGSGMWRWAFLPPKEESPESIYSDLWRGLMRWLIANSGLLPGESAGLTADKVTFNDLEDATATLTLRSESSTEVPAVILKHTISHEPQTFSPATIGDEPGMYRVNFGKLSEGHYEAHAMSQTSPTPLARAVFDVRNNCQEQLDLAARADVMRRIAEESGGAELEVEDPSKVFRLMSEHLDRVHPPQVLRASAWDRWWVLLLGVGLWTLTWGLRRSSGLV